jgi:uncharacterized membrane protein
MYCGIVMILVAVVLYITATNKRRNYYISNYVATGLCAGFDFIASLVLMILNGIWRGKFLQVDFDSWYQYVDRTYNSIGAYSSAHYSDSTLWFDIGFVVYAIIMIASILLVLNLVWKIMLMKGEKRLLNGEPVNGGVLA